MRLCNAPCYNMDLHTLSNQGFGIHIPLEHDRMVCQYAARRAAWVCPEPRVKTGYLARYAKLVSSADKGAVLA